MRATPWPAATSIQIAGSIALEKKNLTAEREKRGLLTLRTWSFAGSFLVRTRWP